MTIGSRRAWRVSAGWSPRSTLTCPVTLCQVCNFPPPATNTTDNRGALNGGYYYHFYYWRRESNPGNKNSRYYEIKRCRQCMSCPPERSSVTPARRQKWSPGTFAKLLCQLPRLTSEPLPENPSRSRDVLNTRAPARPPRGCPTEKGHHTSA